jgi:ribose/xylose/arabinose/galactoside ABC-type transport system permease subunit
LRADSKERTTRGVDIARLWERHGELAVLVLLVVMCALAAWKSKVFLTRGNMRNVLRQASALGVVAVGQTLVILSRGIDLSVGAAATVSCCLSAGIMMGKPADTASAVAVALGFGLIVGLINGLLTTRFALPDFIATLATMSILQGFALIYSGGIEIGKVTTQFSKLSYGSIGILPYSLLLWLAVAIVAGLFLKYTRTGRYIYAVGGDPDVARLSGIPVDRIKILAYSLSGTLAALGGLVLAARMTVGDPTSGLPLQLDSIAAVVVGGTSLFGGRGGMLGAVVGVLVFSVLSNMFNLLGVSMFAQILLKGLVVIAIVTLRVRGEKT